VTSPHRRRSPQPIQARRSGSPLRRASPCPKQLRCERRSPFSWHGLDPPAAGTIPVTSSPERARGSGPSSPRGARRQRLRVGADP
jgi:hypothetical protein